MDENPRGLVADRLLKYAIRAIVLLVVALLAYIPISLWLHRRAVEQASPAGRAVANLQGIVRQRPKDPYLRVKLGDAFVAANRPKEAGEQYRQALTLERDNILALTGLGMLAMDAKDYRAAGNYWQKIVDLREKGQYAAKDRQLEVAYFYLGTAYFEDRDFEESVKYLKKALAIRKDASDTHYLLARAYKELDSEAKFRDELRIAVAFDPSMPEANFDLGELALKDGDIASAAEYFRRSADAAPGIDKPREALEGLGDPADRLDAAKALEKTDQAKALVEARIAVALEPRDPEALRLVGRLFERAKKPEQALSAWQKLLVVLPKDPEAVAAVKRLSNV